MQNSTKLLYRQIADRYVKVVWTHKIQECQADIYLEKSKRTQTFLRILSALTTTGTIAALINGLNTWIVAVITAFVAAASLYLTLSNGDSHTEYKVADCKRFAAIMHNLRNQYESLMTDIKAELLTDKEIVERRTLLEKLENDVYSSPLPATTAKAVKRASKSLKVSKDSTTEEKELELIVPSHLQIDK